MTLSDSKSFNTIRFVKASASQSSLPVVNSSYLIVPEIKCSFTKATEAKTPFKANQGQVTEKMIFLNPFFKNSKYLKLPPH
jgi:hypothetical protein